MNEFDLPAVDLPAVTDNADSVSSESSSAPLAAPAPVPANPVRVAAGRMGARRVHELTEFGREYEREHGLTPGRQRLRQLIQLGKRYEQEHGLRIAKPRRRKKGDAWQEFLTALARVVKPAYRPHVEQLVAKLAEAQRPASGEAA